LERKLPDAAGLRPDQDAEPIGEWSGSVAGSIVSRRLNPDQLDANLGRGANAVKYCFRNSTENSPYSVHLTLC
jgi:hypothetical protein